MSTQHTPGPWSIQRNETPSDTSVGSAKDGYRFEIWNTEIKRTGTRWNNRRIALCNSYENAQLIAAAPDMLKELEGCLRVAKAHYLDMVDQYTDDDPDIEEHLRHAHPNIAAAAMEVKRIETIIRKATGNI